MTDHADRRRATLRRAYRDTPRPAGVYCVRNLRDGRALVVRSTDVRSGLNRERSSLRFGGHPHAALQRDWDALGADAFAFEVLDTLTPPAGRPDYDPADDLRVLEAMWHERLLADGVHPYGRAIAAPDDTPRAAPVTRP